MPLDADEQQEMQTTQDLDGHLGALRRVPEGQPVQEGGGDQERAADEREYDTQTPSPSLVPFSTADWAVTILFSCPIEVLSSAPFRTVRLPCVDTGRPRDHAGSFGAREAAPHGDPPV